MASWFDLTGKVALVTGGGRGLGRSIAARMALAGASVAVNEPTDAGAAETVQEILASGGKAIAVGGDVADEASVAAMFAQIDVELGAPDIVVNNAGVAEAHDILETDLATWQRVLGVNLTGAFLCSKAALTRLRDRAHNGRIIMIGSMVAHQGAVKGWPSYGASKSGLHGLAKSLARTGAAYGVTVNIVAPGVIATDLLHDSHGTDGVKRLTDQIPLGYLGRADDVAAAVHFLASSEAAYITGATIDVNGGMYIRA